MAQTGYTPISIYYSSTAAATPTAGNLVAGELAINTADGKLFYKDSAGVVQVIAGKGGAGVAGGSNTQVQYNSSGSLAGSANMTFDGTNLAIGGYTTSTSFRPTGSTVPTNGMYLPATNSLGFATNSATALTISSTANFGFGVSSNWDTYTSVLQIPAGAIGSYVPNLDLTMAQNAYYAGGWKYTGTGFSNRFTLQNGDFTFSNTVTGTAGNAITWLERMRIAANGNVGINNANPNAALDVAGGGFRVRGYTSNSATDGYNIQMGVVGNVGYIQSLNNQTPNQISIDGNPVVFRVYSGGFVEAARFNSNSNLVLAGGTTTANGVGITFPATQGASTDANCLDDYEEGTWTPVLQFGGASTGITYSSRGGRYTKIGNVVTYTGYINLTSKGSSTGEATFTGLPFSADTTNRSYTGNGQFDQNGNTPPVSIQILSYGTTVYNRYGNANSFASISDGTFTNTSVYFFSATYLTT